MGILFQLRSTVKMMLVIVLIAGNITIIRRVLAANSGTSLINLAAMACLKMFAGIFDVQIPIVITDVHFRSFMHQVPANIVKIGLGFRRLNRQRKVTTTQTLTLLAIPIILRHKYTSKS